MSTYIRKTKDIYIIQGYYSLGWEDLTIEETLIDAKQCLKDYNDNEFSFPHRMIKKRMKKVEL